MSTLSAYDPHHGHVIDQRNLAICLSMMAEHKPGSDWWEYHRRNAQFWRNECERHRLHCEHCHAEARGEAA